MENGKAADIASWQEAIREYAVALNDVGSYMANPLKGYKGTEYSIELKEQLGKDIGDVLEKISLANNSFRELRQWANLPLYEDRIAIDEILKLEELLCIEGPVISKLIFAEEFDRVATLISAAVEDGIAFNNLDAEIRNTFEESVFTFNVNDAMLEYKKAEIKWFLPEFFDKNKLKKELMIHAKNPSVINRGNLYSYYEKLSNHLRLNINISQISD